METVGFKPFNNDVVVKLPKIEEKTAFGVVKSKEMIEEELKRMDKFLPVIEISDRCAQVAKGDWVLISKGSHPSFVENDNTYLIVNELHVLGKRVVHEEKAEV